MTSEPLPKPTPFTGNLRSPCVSICRMDVDSGYCEGCFRTIEEIADWGMMSDDRKREVWQALRQRQATLHPPAPAEAGHSGSAPAVAIPTTAPPLDPPLKGRQQPVGYVSRSRQARR